MIINTKRLQAAEEMRQQALDYINANPGQLCPVIVSALGWKTHSGLGRLRRMVEGGELHRVPAIQTLVDDNGVEFHQRTHAYTALVKTTRSADSVDAIRDGKYASVERAPKTTQCKWVNGRYINNKQDRDAKPCPDAMGSGRQRVFAGSSCSMV